MEFLLLFAARNGKDKNITTAAELFGVSKPTVLQITYVLEQRGLLEIRDGHGTIALTDTGWQTAKPLLNLQREATAWLTAQARLEPCVAEKTARKLVTEFEPEIIRAMLDSGAQTSEPPGEETPCLDSLSPGYYLIDFEVRKNGSRELSMGDQGFAKPAELKREAKGGKLYLRARQLEYRSGVWTRLLRGTLERLWYQQDGVWHECERDKKEAWIIPYITLRWDEEKQVPVLRSHIRARSTVGPMKMPESEAELVLFPESARRLSGEKKEKKAGMQ